MQVGVIGLREGGALIARRLLAGGHQCVVFDRSPRLVAELAAERAFGAASLSGVVRELDAPRAIVLAGPSDTWDATIAELMASLEAGDVVVVFGNGAYVDDIRRAGGLAARGIHHVDVGLNGAWEDAQGTCCLSIGGDASAVQSLDPLFLQLVSGAAAGTYLLCGSAGAGHFVSMTHDVIASKLAAVYAEGLHLLREQAGQMEMLSRYDLDVPAIARLWRTGSPIGSPILDRIVEAPGGQPVPRTAPNGAGPQLDVSNGCALAT